MSAKLMSMGCKGRGGCNNNDNELAIKRQWNILISNFG